MITLTSFSSVDIFHTSVRLACVLGHMDGARMLGSDGNPIRGQLPTLQSYRAPGKYLFPFFLGHGPRPRGPPGLLCHVPHFTHVLALPENVPDAPSMQGVRHGFRA